MPQERGSPGASLLSGIIGYGLAWHLMIRKKNQWGLIRRDSIAVRNRHSSVLAQGAVRDLDT
jgi:hypothetical protein